jgi:hypothetical protein
MRAPKITKNFENLISSNFDQKEEQDLRIYHLPFTKHHSTQPKRYSVRSKAPEFVVPLYLHV